MQHIDNILTTFQKTYNIDILIFLKLFCYFLFFFEFLIFFILLVFFSIIDIFDFWYFWYFCYFEYLCNFYRKQMPLTTSSASASMRVRGGTRRRGAVGTDVARPRAKAPRGPAYFGTAGVRGSITKPM